MQSLEKKLFEAACNGDTKAVALLLDRGADARAIENAKKGEKSS